MQKSGLPLPKGSKKGCISSEEMTGQGDHPDGSSIGVGASACVGIGAGVRLGVGVGVEGWKLPALVEVLVVT